MKKIIAIVLSMVMAMSVCSMAVIPAMAKSVASPGSDVPAEFTIEVGKDVTYSRDDRDPSIITFTYNGDGTVKEWDFPGMVLGVDYEIVSQADDLTSITIQMLKDEDGNYIYDGVVKAKAILEQGQSNTDPTKPNQEDKTPTSPKTGAASAAGIAVMGAGVAILAALKKKDQE